MKAKARQESLAQALIQHAGAKARGGLELTSSSSTSSNNDLSGLVSFRSSIVVLLDHWSTWPFSTSCGTCPVLVVDSLKNATLESSTWLISVWRMHV